MNDPNTKYAHNKVPAEESNIPEENRDLLFFNYHEFLIEDFEPLRGNVKEGSLVVNHFPNVYAPMDSVRYKTTRVVRIPRVYHTVSQSNIIPQFSNEFPGREEAAILNDDQQNFVPYGAFDANFFGRASLTPLVPDLMSFDEFKSMVDVFNSILYDAFNPFSFSSLFENLLDFFTANFYSFLFNKLFYRGHMKMTLEKLDNLIEEKNQNFVEHNRSIKIVSPKRSGFLSLDIEIPKPVP